LFTEVSSEQKIL